MTASRPCILLFNINGSGMGHLSRCLAYARQLREHVRPVFYSLASAIDVIEEMGFAGDYFVSEFWSDSHISAWNRELAVRLGILLEEVKPCAVLFDGTWPFHGFMDACDVARVPIRIWSNRGLHKPGFHPVPVDASRFDLVLTPGEIGDRHSVLQESPPGRRVRVPPVTIFDDEELLDRNDARAALGLAADRRYVLLSPGPGNLKDVDELSRGLISLFEAEGYHVVYACAPISKEDVPLPSGATALSVFPLSKYMRAFDIFVGAAGYNTCCEVLQANVPSILVPNQLVADDQVRRAELVTRHAPVVVSSCETGDEREQALRQLFDIGERTAPAGAGPRLDGAAVAAEEILALMEGRAA